MIYYVVEYRGVFGFLKPWSAVRDEEIASQVFLTPSVLHGMCQSLGVASIARHRLSFDGMSTQQEVVHAPCADKRSERAILKRRLLVNPALYLAFHTEAEAIKAQGRHLALCRHEDLVFPSAKVRMVNTTEWDSISGFEFEETNKEAPGSAPVGYNRFAQGEMMFGKIHYTA